MRLRVAMLAIGILLVAGSVGMAQVPFPPVFDEGGVPDPALATGVLEWTDAGWVELAADDHRAEAFHIGFSYGYWCNGQYVNEATNEVEVGPWKFYVGASVAQYLEANLSNNALAWYIAKPYLLDPITEAELPRTWAADSITLQLKSNGDVVVAFDSFGPLIGTKGGEIPSMWNLVHGAGAVYPPPPDDPTWMTGDWRLLVPEVETHPLLTYKLWNKLDTQKCTTACLYEDIGAIFFVLDDQKEWVVEKLSLPVIPRPDP